MREPRLFTVIRHADETGISGTGRVLDGVIFHNGQVVVIWRADVHPEKPGYSSLGIFPRWEAFKRVHIDSHPANRTEVVFGTEKDLGERLRAAGLDAHGMNHPSPERGQPSD